ncbi:MAG: hypothetical protein FWD78_08165 [Treponema sp.]|nr:hypothetical protein [Treponema sp.]
MKFIGFHGTDLQGARQIENVGFQDSSSDSWLGPGIYFFETQSVFNGLEASKWWVKIYKKYPQWVILEAEIISNNVLDLFGNLEDRVKFGQIKKHLLEKHLKSGGKEENFTLKVVFLHLSRNVEVIRGLVDAARLEKFSNFIVGYPQIQICVTKSSCIGKLTWKEDGEING